MFVLLSSKISLQPKYPQLLIWWSVMEDICLQNF